MRVLDPWLNPLWHWLSVGTWERRPLASCQGLFSVFMDPFALLCTIVISVLGLGLVPFVHGRAGSLSQVGACFTFCTVGVWWIDSLWPIFCRNNGEYESDIEAMPLSDSVLSVGPLLAHTLLGSG